MHTTMKDSLKDLFSERFQGHEAPVDPAMWQVIEARLLTAAPVADPVNDLFRERFNGHEVNVTPNAWQNISQQMGHGVSAGGAFGGYGWIAAGIGGLLLTGGLIYSLSGQPDQLAQAPTTAVEELAQERAATPKITVTTPAMEAAVSEEHHAAIAPRTQGPTANPETLGQGSAASIVIPATVQGSQTEKDQDTSGAQVVRQIIAAMTTAAERDLLQGNSSANGGVSPAPGGTQGPQDSTPVPEPADQDPVAPAEPCTLFLENIFTPNNDQVNDEFRVEAPPCITSARIRIFSINGQLVHTMNNYEPWTGANCEEGWYIVAGEASTVNGDMVPLKGTVMLKRSGNN